MSIVFMQNQIARSKCCSMLTYAAAYSTDCSQTASSKVQHSLSGYCHPGDHILVPS